MAEQEPFTLSFQINDDKVAADYLAHVVIAKAHMEGVLWVAVEATGFDPSSEGAEAAAEFLEDVARAIRSENAEHLGAVPEQPRRFNPQPVAKRPEKPGWRRG